jgi:hypothetical protein
MGESSQAWSAAGTANGRIVDPCLRLAATLIASVPSFTKPAAATTGTPAPPLPAQVSQLTVAAAPLQVAMPGEPAPARRASAATAPSRPARGRSDLGRRRRRRRSARRPTPQICLRRSRTPEPMIGGTLEAIGITIQRGQRRVWRNRLQQAARTSIHLADLHTRLDRTTITRLRELCTPRLAAALTIALITGLPPSALAALNTADITPLWQRGQPSGGVVCGPGSRARADPRPPDRTCR